MKKLILLFLLCLIGCERYVPVKEIVYVPIQDSAQIENVAKIIRLEYDIACYQDSLAYVRDSIGEDLFVARYKLARIKEYNRIAAKGNNIKFLRGWINRTLEE